MIYDLLKMEAEPYLNTLVLYGLEVVKLCSVSKDENDYYYDIVDIKGEKRSISAAIGITFLKGKIFDREYEQRVWQWNEVFKRKYEELIVK